MTDEDRELAKMIDRELKRTPHRLDPEVKKSGALMSLFAGVTFLIIVLSVWAIMVLAVIGMWRWVF